MLSPSRVFAASPARALALIRVIPSKPVAGMGGSLSRHRTRDAPVGTARVVANAVASDATDATDAPPVLTSANLRAWIDARNDDGAGSRVELVKCPNDTPDVESSAMALGVPVDSIVKSIVFACDGCFAVCVTNGTARVDHKKIARRLGLANKRVRLATREETVAHAGYVPGTVPPFGHRTKLRTFVALDVVNDMDPDDVVFGGGGCVDVEVRCTVRDLVRLCEPCEVMDVKRDDDVSRGDESAGASTIATKSKTLISADESRTAASDANDLPVPIDPSLDERTGPNALPIAKRVADVVGQTPATLERLSMPAWPATRPKDGDPASPHRVVTATAEVTRVRRVARFLAFATLRPLAPLRIAPKCENGDAGEEEEEEEEEEVPLAPGTTLQLIAGRTLLERMGGEAGMENTLRGLRPGAVLAVTGRLQANPRPLTVDVVSSGISFVDGTEAVTLLAHAERDGFGIDGDGSSSRTGIDSMPPGSAGVTHTAWSRHKRLDKKREKKKLAEGSSRDDDDVPGGVPMSNDELRVVLRGLRTGERVGKTSKFPALPRESVTWVDSVASIHEMRSAVLDPSTRCDSSLVHDGPSSGDDGINHDRAPWVVGLDAEWRPHKHSPVALLQVAVRHRAFLVDVSHLMKRPGDDGYVPGNEEAFDHFLRDLLAAEEIVRLGFGFGYDLQRLRRGYAGRLHSLEISESEDDGKGKREPIVSEFGETGHPVLGDAVVDVKAVAMYAFPGKQKLVRVGLATVVSSVLGAYVDKTEQCSDWERRPLTNAQIDYAAADAHVLTVLFDRCFHHSPDAIATALADPTRPLAVVPEAPKGARVNKRERRDKAEENHRRQVERFIAPVGPPPHPGDVPSVVGDVFEGRKQVSAAFGGDGSSSGRGGGVDECGDFLALFVNVGRTNRRYANEFWVEFESNEVVGSKPCGGKVMMSWFPGGGGLREIASALVDTEGEEGKEEESTKVRRLKTPLLFLRPAKGAYTCVGRLDPVRTRVSGEGGARVDFHLVDAPVLHGVDPGAFARLVGVGLTTEECDRFLSSLAVG